MDKYIYYAHHLYKYDTKIEEYEIDIIYREFKDVKIINPNGDLNFDNLTNEDDIMRKCLGEIKRPDVFGVVFSSLSGVVGKGVYCEVKEALALNKDVYYINNNKIYLCNNNEEIFEIINKSNRIYAIVKCK